MRFEVINETDEEQNVQSSTNLNSPDSNQEPFLNETSEHKVVSNEKEEKANKYWSPNEEGSDNFLNSFDLPIENDFYPKTFLKLRVEKNKKHPKKQMPESCFQPKSLERFRKFSLSGFKNVQNKIESKLNNKKTPNFALTKPCSFETEKNILCFNKTLTEKWNPKVQSPSSDKSNLILSEFKYKTFVSSPDKKENNVPFNSFSIFNSKRSLAYSKDTKSKMVKTSNHKVAHSNRTGNSCSIRKEENSFPKEKPEEISTKNVFFKKREKKFECKQI